MKRGISPIISVVLIVAFIIIIFFLVTNWAQREIVEESTEGKEETVIKTVSSWDVNAKINSAEVTDIDEVELKIENTGQEDIEKFKVKIIGTDGVDIVETTSGVAVLRILTEDVEFDVNTVGDVTDIEIYPVVNDEVYASVKADVGEESAVGEIGTELVTGNSCFDIKTKNPDASNGDYKITPDEDEITVYCDMDNNGFTVMESCLELFNNNLNGNGNPQGAPNVDGNGDYKINPDGSIIDVYCDMDNGGYTVMDNCWEIFDNNLDGLNGNPEGAPGITGNGVYRINPSGSVVSTYCDMETDGGGWTLVWVGTGKTFNGPGSLTAMFLADTFDTSIDRNDISAGTSVSLNVKVIENWPGYTELYYERWLPDSLVGRSYAAPGWAINGPYSVSDVPTNMNFWSSSRQDDVQGWRFVPKPVYYCSDNSVTPTQNWYVYGDYGDPILPRIEVCITTSRGWTYEVYKYPLGEKSHVYGCWGCRSNYMWFQHLSTWRGTSNRFYPDSTYGYWRITSSSHYSDRWPEYDALSEGDPMPGYGLYVR